MADSFNELFGLGGHSEDASIEAWWPLQDDAASTAIDDVTSNAKDATLEGGDDTQDLSISGPNSWLAKAFDCNLSAGNAYGTFSTITLPDGPITVLWRHKPPGGTASQWVLGNSGDNFQLAIINLGANNLGFRSDSAGADYRWTDSNINDSSTWRSWGITTDGTTANAYKDSVDMGAAGTASGSDFSSSIDRLFRRSAGTYCKAAICDISVWTRELSSAEVSQWHSGPELRSTASGIVFSDDGTFNIGTWALPSPFAAGSNGSQTQEVIAVNAAGAVLDTASTAMGTLDLSSEAGNTCYLLARVSNSGGYDIGDHGSRTSGYGSADDGYYELASVTAAGGGDTEVTISESMSVSDTVAASDIVAEVAISESLAVSDTYSALPSVVALLAESMAVQDAVAASDIVAQAVLAESLTVQDSALVTDVVVEVAISESLAVADSWTTDSAIEVIISESLAIADGVAMSDIVAEVTISESLAIGDAAAASDIVANATIAESLAVSESIAGGTVTDATISESLAVTDAYSTAEALPPSLYLFYHYIMLGRSDLVPLGPTIASYAWEFWDASEGITYDGGVDNWQGTLQARNLVYTDSGAGVPLDGFTVAQDGPFNDRPYLKLPRISATSRWEDLSPATWSFMHNGTTDWTMVIPLNNPTLSPSNNGTLIDTSNEGGTAGVRLVRRSDERIWVIVYGDGGATIDSILPAVGTQPNVFQQLVWVDYELATGIIRIEIDGVEVGSREFPSLSSEDCHGMVLKDPNAGMDFTLPAIFVAKSLFTGDEKTYLRTLFQRRYDTPQLTPTIYVGISESMSFADTLESSSVQAVSTIGDDAIIGDDFLIGE